MGNHLLQFVHIISSAMFTIFCVDVRFSVMVYKGPTIGFPLHQDHPRGHPMRRTTIYGTMQRTASVRAPTLPRHVRNGLCAFISLT